MQVMTVVEGKIPKAKTHEFLAMYASVRDQAKPPGWKGQCSFAIQTRKACTGYPLSGIVEKRLNR